MASPLNNQTSNYKKQGYFALQSNSTLTVRKTHCVLYDLFIQKTIEDILSKNKLDRSIENKYNYYKELYKENFESDLISYDINNINKIISSIFDKSDLKKKDNLLKYFNENKKTLFVIPVYFDDEQNVNRNDNSFFDSKKNKNLKEKIYDDFLEKLQKKGTEGTERTFLPLSTKNIEQSHDKIINLYYLPCLINNNTPNMNEEEYLKRLKDELIILQDTIREDFTKKFSESKRENIYKNISFFCDPNGDISLKFYKKAVTNTTKKFLNKYLFTEIEKLKTDINEGKQKILVDSKIERPLIYTKTNTQITAFVKNLEKEITANANNSSSNADNSTIYQFISFLIQQILNNEIIGELKNFTYFDTSGIEKLQIVFKSKIKRDLYDFDSLKCFQKYRFIEKKLKNSFLEFKLDRLIECKNVEKKQTEDMLKKKYWKINLENNSYENIGNLEDEKDNLYLKVTSSDYLMHAIIYVKKNYSNIYEEKRRGILQLGLDDEIYKKMETTNLSRNIDSKSIYFYKNFDFTHKSFDDYLKEHKNIVSTSEITEPEKKNGEAEKKEKKGFLNSIINFRGSKKEEISPELRRKHFIDTFTSKQLLNEYYLFCINHPKYKKLVDRNTTDDKKEVIEKILQNLLRELIKKGEIFFINKRSQKGKIKDNSQNSSDTVRSYNKYIIDSIDKNEIILQVKTQNAEGEKEVFKFLSDKRKEDSVKKMIKKTETSGGYYSLLTINLKEEKSDNKLNRNTNNGKNTNALKNKLSKEKCSKRKKTIKNSVGKIVKNVTRKIYLKGKAIM